MQLLTSGEFMSRTLGGRPIRMDLGPYVGQSFECACGAAHLFDSESVRVLRELGGMRLVLACPDGEAVTCVKAKGILRFKGFASLFGTQPEPEADPERSQPSELAEGLPDELERFVRARVSHADHLACSLWESLGVEPDIRSRHFVATVAAAMATSSKPAVDAEVCIDAASRYLDNPTFDAFLHEPDVRNGLRQLASDSQSASKAADAPRLSEILQTFLVMRPLDPSSLSASESKAVV